MNRCCDRTFLLGWLGLLSIALTSEPSPENRISEKLREAESRDLHVDDLPAGAVSRLGALRLKHRDRVACVAFAPDGKSLASGDDRGNLCIWDAKTGQEIRRLK